MVSLGVASPYTNIPIVNKLNIFKNYVNNNDHLLGKRLYLKTRFPIYLIWF